MSLFRYNQIKRFWHISDPRIVLDTNNWFMKLFPMFTLFRAACKAYLIPSQNVSYDEMMVAFRGRVMHTKKAPYKPIDEGFQLWGLCDSGYLVDFAFYSLIHGKSP
jgi:hypothetical protein